MTNNYDEHVRREDPLKDFLADTPPQKDLLMLNVALALVYFCVLTFFFPVGNPWLFGLLIFGEVFHLGQVLSFIWTVWDTGYKSPRDDSYRPAVDVFITVAGEPV